MGQQQIEHKKIEHKKNRQESPQVEIYKTFRAPVAQVFKLWTNEKLVRHWYGPRGMSCPFARVNFKIGGKYLLAMRSSEDEKNVSWSTGTFVQIIANKKIVMSDHFANEKGQIIGPQEAGYPGPWPDEVAYITVEFERAKGLTHLKVTHQGLPEWVHDSCIECWTSSLEKLKQIVEPH